MNKSLKYTLTGLGIILVAVGAWKTADYFLGITRLKYATYKHVEYDVPPINSDEVE